MDDAGGGDAGRGQFGGLFGCRVVRQALDDLDEVILGVESLGLAVGDQGVEKRVVGTGSGIAEEEVVFCSEFGRTNFVFGKIIVDLKAAVFQANENFPLLVDGVGERFSQRIVRKLCFPGSMDKSEKFVGDRA